MLKQTYYKFGAAITVGMLMASSTAHAQAIGGSGGSTFSTIAANITESIESIPGLLTAVSYLMGLLLGVLGVLKIKDHVENPSNAKLSEGAIRLAAGGALFALPILFDAMFNTIDAGVGGDTEAATLNAVEFNVQ